MEGGTTADAERTVYYLHFDNGRSETETEKKKKKMTQEIWRL